MKLAGDETLAGSATAHAGMELVACER